ncbi:short-chain dehydrogenase [Pigmentiphaga sp. NML080357]|uniref:SDR family oxidoreductase n=1 Tax=Pigmentiphaga sp. NML080357 TaxID=2008675 RepID=UPI000B4225AB|nr:SDR family oxidoreductase [Pigmentiphaga sp. NML080357]OVZ65323.1 short-chain dehydrogenase [Pigmentiphaga sp. NML080357]
MQIKNSVALVTGGNRGLGKALVQALRNAGAAKVYAAAREPSTISTSEGVVPVRLDVIDPSNVRALANELRDVNILVNNAGIIIRSPSILDPASLESLRQEAETNVLGPLALAQAFAPVLAANGGGAILNVLSALSWISLAGVETYSATKSAAWSLTNGLRHALSGQGTQVVALHVGFMDTDMTRALPVQKADPEEVARAAVEGIERGESEVLADATSAQLKQALGTGVYLSPVPAAAGD